MEGLRGLGTITSHHGRLQMVVTQGHLEKGVTVTHPVVLGAL